MEPAKAGTRVRVLSPKHLRGLIGVVDALAGPMFDCIVILDALVQYRRPFFWSELEPVTP